MLVAEVPAQQRAGAAVPVLEDDAAAAAIAQHRGEEIPGQPVEMHLALRMHGLVERVAGIHPRVVGIGIARGHALCPQLRPAAQLAPQVAAAAGGQARQVLVQVAEVDRHIGQRLALHQHEALPHAGLGQRLGVGVVLRGQQRRILRKILRDHQREITARPCAQRRGDRLRHRAPRQRGVLRHRGAREGRAHAQPPRPALEQRPAAQPRLELVVRSRQQVERRREHRHRQSLQPGEPFRRMRAGMRHERLRLQPVAPAHGIAEAPETGRVPVAQTPRKGRPAALASPPFPRSERRGER